MIAKYAMSSINNCVLLNYSRPSPVPPEPPVNRREVKVEDALRYLDEVPLHTLLSNYIVTV